MMLPIILLFIAVNYSLCAEICYPPCGCWTDDPPFDERPLPTLPGEGNTLRYELFTLDNPDVPIIIDWNDIPAEFDPTKKTVFYAHGWITDASLSYSTKDAYFDANHDINFIAVDWSEGADEIWYPQSASNTRLAGACTAYLATQLIASGASWGDMHCTGISLGAHTCGYMGLTSGGALGRITGLDPAGPWFDFNDPNVNLDKTDAQFVDITHTNIDSLGTLEATGHVDFYPNNGRTQPGCDSDVCDHGIAILFHIASISNPEFCQFSARPCESEIDADLGLCDSCGAEGCNRMGLYATPTPSGRMYLQTVADPPYCAD